MDAYQESENVDESFPEWMLQIAEHFEQQPNIQSTNTTGTYLEHINDDCLLDIFSVNSLSLVDLCSLAETCTRFQQIIQRVKSIYALRFDFMSEKGRGIAARKYSDGEYVQSQDVERIFKNCGSCLTEVSICRSSNFVLNLIREYCVDELKILRTVKTRITAAHVVYLKPILKRLEELDLYAFDITEDNKTLFSNLDSLIELRLAEVSNSNIILQSCFPKLERFFWDCVINNQLFISFISRHTSLKTLHATTLYSGKNKDAMNIFHVIVNSCKELKELDLDIGDMRGFSIQPLQDLKSLKILKLMRANCKDIKFFAVLTKLRELHLDDCDLPKDSIQFASLAQLTKLYIRNVETRVVDVVGIIRQLMNLEELEVCKWTGCLGSGDYILDEETFSRIIAVVKGRPNILTLECKYNFDFNYDENRKVRLLRYNKVLWSKYF